MQTTYGAAKAPTIHETVRETEEAIRQNKDRENTLTNRIQSMCDAAEKQGRTNATDGEQVRVDAMFKDIESLRSSRKRLNARLAKAREVEAEEIEYEKRSREPGYRLETRGDKNVMIDGSTGRPFTGEMVERESWPFGKEVVTRFQDGVRVGRNGESVTTPGKPSYDQVFRVGSEPRVYSQDQDPEAKGTGFITDVIGAFRGNPQSTERLARHAREYEVDNQGRKTRALGDVATGNLPNLIVPAYLVAQYAAKPSAARPFANICTHVDLPPTGMKAEIAKANTTSNAAIQTSELVAVAGGSFDLDPLELSVETAESWNLISRQAIDRGRVTENVVMDDMLSQMDALLDKQIMTEATTGLYASGTRITYDSASPKVEEMYPYILQGASKITQTLLNRGKATHVIVHPRRMYWMQSLLGTGVWPLVSQPGIPTQAFAAATGAGYDEGVGMVLPGGLKVIMDANVQTAALAGADTGGTQDIIYVVPQSECLLLESPQREVFIRAEAPAASQLGVLLVCYSYFAYTFSRYASTAFQRINGTGTVPPAGF